MAETLLRNVFVIPGNVPSSKNSRVWTGKFFVASKSTNTYIRNTKQYYKEYAQLFKTEAEKRQKPLRVSFKSIRGTKHKFDYINPLQTVQDLMVRNGWLPDDNSDEIIPVFEEYEYDKEHAGVMITLL